MKKYDNENATMWLHPDYFGREIVMDNVAEHNFGMLHASFNDYHQPSHINKITPIISQKISLPLHTFLG